MIELHDVTIQIGDCHLKNLSFTIDSGQYAVLMGRTGLGKTTLLESICGLRKIESGRIIIRGTDVTHFSPGDRSIGYVPQDLALFPTMSVAEHLAFAMRLRKQPHAAIRTRVDEMASLLGITHLLARGVTHLSGGEAQRVALGRALAFGPSVLLLDEPLSALDESTREDMHRMLRDIKSHTKTTTLHVTHNQGEAKALADVVFVLDSSEISKTVYTS
jgi:ABC-type sugar transport system ATPase subunit